MIFNRFLCKGFNKWRTLPRFYFSNNSQKIKEILQKIKIDSANN